MKGWFVVLICTLVSLMALLDVAAWTYQRQEQQRNAQARRQDRQERARERAEEQSHIFRVGGPVVFFVGKDGVRYAWVD